MTGVRNIYSVMHPSVGLTPRSSAQSCVRPSSAIRSSISSLAEEMEEKDLHYLAVLSTRKRLLPAFKWPCELPRGDAEDVRIADQVRIFCSAVR